MPRPGLLQLPDELLFRVLQLASSAAAPLRDASLMALCSQVFKFLAARATSLVLMGPAPTPAVLALLRSAPVRHVDITRCAHRWPLTELLPHLEHVESVATNLTFATVRDLPATLPRVRVRRVSMSSWAGLELVARLQQRLQGGTLVIEELCDAGSEKQEEKRKKEDVVVASNAESVGWGDIDVRRAHLTAAALPACVWRATSLTALRLSDLGGPADVPVAIGALVHLKSLEIERCRALTALPAAIGSLTALMRLAVADCDRFRDLPSPLSTLPSLETLSLKHLPSLTSLPSEIGQLSALKRVDLARCGLQSLPTTIGRLSRLEVLEIERCDRLPSLPDEISSLRSLQSLHLRCTPHHAMRFPSGIELIISLRTLELSMPLPAQELAALGTLDSLQSLHVDLSAVSGACPPFFLPLARLTALSLSRCARVTDFPDMHSLAELRELAIDGAESLQHFPQGAESLAQLTRLRVSGGRFEKLPGALSALASLLTMQLTQCAALKALPDSLGSIAALRHLDLTGCRALAALPPPIAALSALTFLSLERCRAIAALPDALGKLSMLRELHLQDCASLKSLPSSVSALPALERLDLTGCRSLVTLPSTLGGGADATSAQLVLHVSCGALLEELSKRLPKSVALLRGLYVTVRDDEALTRRAADALGALHDSGILQRLTLGKSAYERDDVPSLLELLQDDGMSELMEAIDVLRDEAWPHIGGRPAAHRAWQQ